MTANDHSEISSLDLKAFQDVSSYTPSQAVMPYSNSGIFGNYDDVGFAGDWTHVKYQDWQYPRNSVEVEGDHLLVTTTKAEWIPDTDAQAELRALVEKWKAEGKDYLNEFDKQATWDETESISDSMGHYETKRVVAEWPIADCTFLKWISTEVRIARYSRWSAYDYSEQRET